MRSFTPLEGQQVFLGTRGSTEFTEAPIGANDTMARLDERHGISGARTANGPSCTGSRKPCGQLPIGQGFSVWDRRQVLLHLAEELVWHSLSCRQIEVFAGAREIFLELLRGKFQRVVVQEHWAAELSLKLFDHALEIVILEGHVHDLVVNGCHEKLSYG